jgi:hypothetical protein
MTSPNPDSLFPGPLPKGLTEADLLDWVEQSLPTRRLAEVHAALRTNPPLAARLEEMRVDRAAVAAIGLSTAPATLMDAVEQALERHLLVGLSSGEPLSDRPPVSIFTPSRRDPFRLGSFRGDAVGRRLALAATLLLVAGGATIVAVLAMRLAATSTPPTFPIAINTPDDSTKGLKGPAETGEAHPVIDGSPVELAEAPVIDSDAALRTEALADAGPAEPTISLARAVELAREGRLVVRIRSGDVDRTLLRFGRMADRPRQAWRLTEDAPTAIVAGLQTEPPRLVDPRIEPVILSDWSGIPGLDTPMFPFPAMAPPRFEIERVIPTVFLAQVRTDEASLRGMIAALNATSIHSAALEESPTPLAMPAPSLDADAILWWTQAPQGWRPWAQVPVVVAAEK